MTQEFPFVTTGQPKQLAIPVTQDYTYITRHQVTVSRSGMFYLPSRVNSGTFSKLYNLSRTHRKAPFYAKGK